MQSVILYKNSGFNSYNIPDSETLLNRVTHFSVPSLDIITDRFLNYIAVKSTESDIKDVDFAKVGNCFYAVTGYNPYNSCTDTWVLMLSPQPILTAGLSNLQVADGITERIHISKNADDDGIWPEEDELMRPSMPMEIDTEFLGSNLATVYATYVETTLDYEAMADDDTGITYTDSVSGESVCVPQTIAEKSETQFRMVENYGGSSPISHGAGAQAGTKIVRFMNESNVAIDVKVREGIAKAFSLGVENAGIVNKAKLPVTRGNSNVIVQTYDTGTTRKVAKLESVPFEYTSSLDYMYDEDVRNRKINYNNFCKYGIMSASGEKMECDVATIIGDGIAPKITEWDDPHLDGKPYFRFHRVNGSTSFEGFWQNCISGLQWKQTPMIYTEKQGSALDKISYDMDATISAHQRERQVVSSTIGAVKGVVQGAAQGFMTGGIAGAIAGGGLAGVEAGVNATYDKMEYRDSRLKAATDYALSQNVVQPQVQFPYNSETVRDFMGNGVLVYRYKYTAYDISRIDKLLTMYGYKITKDLEITDFFTRPQFNYIKAHGVSFTGNFPQWLLDECAKQVEGGVRVWHILPNVSAYTDNEPDPT